ncbi:hypothetical protein INT47_004386, partial [Mucor saturninus]
KDDIDKVRHMLQSGMDVNSSFPWNAKDTYSPVIPNHNKPDNLQTDQEYQCKPLNIAVLGGHPNMVRLLLSAGADINNKDGRGRTPLVCAIYGLDLDASNIDPSNLYFISQTNPSHFDIMKNILLCHPNLYYATLDSPQYEIKGITPLCLASYLGKSDIIQLLLDDGRVNVDGTDSKNATALMYAARDGNVPIVKILLDYHASPDITDSHGWSAIQYAEVNPEIVQLCEAVLRIRRSDGVNHAKLSHFITTLPDYPSSLSHLQFDTLKELDHLDPADTAQVQIVQSAFLHAIKIHDHLSLQTLLMKSPSVNGGVPSPGPLLINHHDPKTGLTAFHHAMRTKPLPSLDTITLLYQAGADINAQTYYGRTALHHLSRFGRDKDGKSWGIQKNNHTVTPPIQQPITTIQGVPVAQHIAMCASVLIRFGALVNIADPTGNTPLHFAAEFGGVMEVIQVLIMEGGADLNVKNKKQLTPLDVCKTEDMKRKMMALESERRHSKTKSVISSISGTIRPFDSASEYNCSSITRSVSRSFIFHAESKKQVILQQQKQLQGGKTGETTSTTDFDVILKAFFSYQTTFTDSIESSLAYITESILGKYASHEGDHRLTLQQLEKTIGQLRFELNEAVEMFDSTDQLVEKVMMAFREELEGVEQIHQADWELSELQHDKIEKLFDVFERIEGRFCQLELAQDDLISQVERLRKAASRIQTEDHAVTDVGTCVIHLSQSLAILETVPFVLHSRDDRNRLCQDMATVVEKVVRKIDVQVLQESGMSRQKTLKDAKLLVNGRWKAVKELLTKEEVPASSLTRSASLAAHTDTKSKLIFRDTSEPSLNQLELSFDILHSNMYEIQKDIEDVIHNLEKLTKSKKTLYELCLSLEKELMDPTPPGRTKQDINIELKQVLNITQQLLDKQASLEKERIHLVQEYETIQKELLVTQGSLQKVRPPLLLQGLLDRLDTDETPCVRIEKDWKEDPHLVSEVIMMEDIKRSSLEEEEEEGLSTLQSKQLNAQCTSTLAAQCYIGRLDASLYCLKVLAKHLISQARHSLVQVQAALGQASTDLDETRNHMTQLYDDAAEVARQVYALKRELETIVRHRKEEVIKVWEVVDDVSAGVDAKAIQCATAAGEGKKTSSTSHVGLLGDLAAGNAQEENKEGQDRHQWIIRELEQLQHVHESLQDAVEGLKQEQAMIGQRLRQLASAYIEPQVDTLVGQDAHSLLSISDRLAELMDRIRDSELGLRPLSFWSPTTNESVTMVSNTTGTGPRVTTNRTSTNKMSRLSSATNRLSVSTVASKTSYGGRSSVMMDSSKRMSTATTRDKKRMSMISATSLSSLSSYQQERMIARVSNLSSVLAQAKQQSRLSRH